jgi:hypothetical protein
MRVIRFGKRVERRSFSLLDRNDDVGFTGPAGMIQIVARRRGRMIGVRMVVADDAELARTRIRIGALALFGCDQIAIMSRLLPLVLARVDLANAVGRPFAVSKQKAAALVRVRLLAVLPYLIQVLRINFNRHFVLVLRLEVHFIRELHRDLVRTRIEAIQQRIVMRDYLRRSQKLVVDRCVSVTDQSHIIAHADRTP